MVIPVIIFFILLLFIFPQQLLGLLIIIGLVYLGIRILINSKPIYKDQRKTYIIETLYISIDDPFLLIQKLREMHPKDFEDFIVLLYTLYGYHIKCKAPRKNIYGYNKPQKDGGIDITASKGNTYKYIQVKKKTAEQVGVAIVREFYGVITDIVTENDQGIIVTTSIFSEDAKQEAEKNNIKMIDYEELLKSIQKIAYKEERKKSLEDFLNNVDYSKNSKFTKYAKTCPRCYAPLVRRWKLKHYGCLNYHSKKCHHIE